MRVVIMGCGRVGSTLAAVLAEGGHEVTILDTNPDAFRRLPRNFRGTAIVGNGIDEGALRRAGIEKADAFVAITQGDNRNVMAAQIAQRIFNVPRVFCRIYDPIRYEMYKELGVETLSSTIVMSQLFHEAILKAPVRRS
ncbi:MAG: TrkA family potassium uptake protein [Chloroflexi bacterium]|nr:TrkA family potassium uptake protein [Chloroflexota bacterium]